MNPKMYPPRRAGFEPKRRKKTFDDHSALAEKMKVDPDGGTFDACPAYCTQYSARGERPYGLPRLSPALPVPQYPRWRRRRGEL